MSPLRHIIRQLILEGAKERYMRMFDVLPEEVREAYRLKIASSVDWARKTLKKNDAIVWYLRWLRVHIIQEAAIRISMMRDDRRTKNKSDQDQKVEGLMGLRDKLWGKMKIDANNDAVVAAAVNWARRILDYQTTFEHYLSLDIPTIQNYQYGFKLPGKVLQDFGVYEEEWKKKFDGLIPIDGDEQIIMEFDGGQKAWVFLDRASCDVESKAMGHCGNAGGLSTDRILSFRSRVEGPEGQTMWKPHLTFILDMKTNELGEMKGRGNDKPSEKYHPYIVALLKAQELKAIYTGTYTERGVYADEYGDELARLKEKPKEIDITIRGIRGGGYLPENNFRLSDLDQEIQDALIEKKPSLATIKHQYKKFGMTEDLAAKIVKIFREDYEETKWTEAGFVIVEFGQDDEIFDNIIEHLETFGYSNFKAARWAAGVLSFSEWADVGDYVEEDAVEHIYDNLPADDKKRLDLFVTDSVRDEDLNLEEYDGVWDIIQQQATYVAGEAYRSLVHGYYEGTEVGMRSAIYEDLTQWFANYGVIYENGWKHVVRDRLAVEIATSMTDGDATVLEDAYRDHVEVEDLHPPYNGWSGYDEEAAISRAVETLYDDKVIH